MAAIGSYPRACIAFPGFPEREWTNVRDLGQVVNLRVWIEIAPGRVVLSKELQQVKRRHCVSLKRGEKR